MTLKDDLYEEARLIGMNLSNIKIDRDSTGMKIKARRGKWIVDYHFAPHVMKEFKASDIVRLFKTSFDNNERES